MLWVGGTLKHLKGHFPLAQVAQGNRHHTGLWLRNSFPPASTFLDWNNIPDKAGATALTREQNLLCELTRTPLRKQDKHKIYFLGLFLPGVLNCCSSANNLPLRCLNNLLIIQCITQQRGEIRQEIRWISRVYEGKEQLYSGTLRLHNFPRALPYKPHLSDVK